LPATAKVTPVDHIERKGGYATIRRVCIDGVPKIQSWWEFAAKLLNQSWTRPDLAKKEYLNESMAVRITHVGVICFFAIYAKKYERYAFWWNGSSGMVLVEHFGTCSI
jgi:hypothetical protein